MFSIHGKVINTFFTPASEKYPEPSYKVQLLGDSITKDGQTRMEMIDLNIPVDIYNSLKDKIDQSIRIPVGIYVTEKGGIRAFFPKGHAKETLFTE